MSKIKTLKIRGLHSTKDVDIKFKDNTLILVGENGTGKTTCLHIFFYLVSGQWSSLIKYDFKSISITINSNVHSIHKSDLLLAFAKINNRTLRKLPIRARREIIDVFKEQGGDHVSKKVLNIIERNSIPSELLFSQQKVEIDMFDADEEQLIRSSSIFQNQELERSYYEIKESFDSQILYLPTFRRIEKELDSIFKDLNPREINRRRHGLHGFHPSENSYLELVEFGMQDVEDYLDHEQSNLSEYTSHTLNSLTFRFLGDIVERKYHNETPQELESLSKEVIDSVLGRVNEDVLNKSLKDKIKNIITGLSSKKEITEHDLLISHYFNDLYQSHKTIEKSEKKIITFCEVCNSYLGDKKFIYERSTYRAMLKCSKTDKEIYLSTLSSGEKQIISLFSHLYLSGQNKFFVLIDEPELSLSVPWQKRFLEDISNGVFCQGLFAVTHSPFIFQNSLEKYTHGIGEFEI